MGKCVGCIACRDLVLRENHMLGDNSEKYSDCALMKCFLV